MNNNNINTLMMEIRSKVFRKNLDEDIALRFLNNCKKIIQIQNTTNNNFEIQKLTQENMKMVPELNLKIYKITA